MKKSYYEILEVSPNASPEIIEKAYKTLSKKYHPDLQSKDNEKWAETEFKKIVKAYEILSDPIQKAEYDDEQTLKSNKQLTTNNQPEEKNEKQNVFHVKRYAKSIGTLIYRHTKKSKEERSKDIIALAISASITIVLIILFWKVPFLRNILFP